MSRPRKEGERSYLAERAHHQAGRLNYLMMRDGHILRRSMGRRADHRVRAVSSISTVRTRAGRRPLAARTLHASSSTPTQTPQAPARQVRAELHERCPAPLPFVFVLIAPSVGQAQSTRQNRRRHGGGVSPDSAAGSAGSRPTTSEWTRLYSADLCDPDWRHGTVGSELAKPRGGPRARRVVRITMPGDRCPNGQAQAP